MGRYSERRRALTALLVVLAAASVLLTTASAASAGGSHHKVVLGSKRFAPNGKGFGTAHPRTIYNGGDLSGLVRKIHWHHWDSKKALATGRNHIFKPHGGYYPHPVRIRLTASGLGHCPGSRHRAYRKLHVRVPKKPGGQLGPWRKWAGSKTICKLSF
jgi:hypothetical protein